MDLSSPTAASGAASSTMVPSTLAEQQALMNAAVRESLCLDFGNAARQLTPTTAPSTASALDPLPTADILSSLLKSPEVEKWARDLIVSTASNVLASTTPTTAKILFPNPTEITTEQRQYAQGFLDALTQVQRLNNFKSTTLGSPVLLGAASMASAAAARNAAAAAAAAAVAAAATNTTLATPLASPIPLSSPKGDFDAIMTAIQLVQEHERSSTAAAAADAAKALALSVPASTSTTASSPTTSSLGSSAGISASLSLAAAVAASSAASAALQPPVKRARSETSTRASSIDSDDDGSSSMQSSSAGTSNGRTRRTTQKKDSSNMNDHEVNKLERKRLRNRQAASKCRQKKLERIQELEQQVTEEKIKAAHFDKEMQCVKDLLQALQQRVHAHQQVCGARQ